MADDELDELYGVPPEEFTALRGRLVAAAKRRGDTATAKRIAAARRPTTAAWVVNVLVHDSDTARRGLTDLGLRLRAAHAAMDGDGIRALSAEQRVLVTELVRAAFATAGVAHPSAALRDEVTGTLQAAIADPEVAERLGHLAKAERYTGFGEFGETSPVISSTRAVPAKSPPTVADDAARERERLRLEQLKATLAAAKQAKAGADGRLAERRHELDAAELHLRDAERDRDAARQAYDAAERESRAAADRVETAQAQLTLPA